MQDQPELTPLSPPPPPPADNPRNMPGIVSFILGLLSWLPFCGSFAMNAMIGQVLPNTAAVNQTINAMIICTGVLALVGVILGIVGLLQREKKKVFAIIGLILNLLSGCAFSVVMLLGMVLPALGGF